MGTRFFGGRSTLQAHLRNLTKENIEKSASNKKTNLTKKIKNEIPEERFLINKLTDSYPNEISGVIDIINKVSLSRPLHKDDVSEKLVTFLVTNEIIERSSPTRPTYRFTSKGKKFASLLLDKHQKK